MFLNAESIEFSVVAYPMWHI